MTMTERPRNRAEAAHDGAIFGEVPVAGQRREILDQPLDVVHAVRPVRVPGDLSLLRRSELGIGLPQQPVHLDLQLGNFVGDVDIAGVGQMPKLLDLAFEFRDRAFQIQERSA